MDHWRTTLPPGMMLEVRYEEVITDLEGQSRRIIDRCGIEWDAPRISSQRAKRPHRQLRRPLYGISVGRWRSYEPFLGPLVAALG